MDYETIRATVLGQNNRQHRKLANNTYGRIEGDSVIVKYHDTDIATFRPEGVEYQTGGWWTVTTKDRINRYLPDGWRLWSKDNVWRLSWVSEDWQGADVTRFYDGITLDYEGTVLSGYQPIEDPDKALRRRIARYAKLYTAERLRELYESGAYKGDSWGELFRDESGNGVIGQDHETYLGYLDEDYVMLSLARNALNARGYKADHYLGVVILDDRLGGANRYGEQVIQRSVRQYMTEHLIDGPGGR